MAINLMKEVVSLCKRRGFVYPSSEIYGGIEGCWDYGPLGVLLKNNINKAWFCTMVKQNENIVGLDTNILMNPKIWQASGHVQKFVDKMVDCTVCKQRFRKDFLKEKFKIKKKGKLLCPLCGGKLTKPRMFNLMIKTHLGVVEDESSITYLRPETCQGIYVNFENIRESMRLKIPFGIAQIGKAFRNEVTLGNFIFRMREFEQMEMQFFVKPDQASKWFSYWVKQRLKWYQKFGLAKNKLRFRLHSKDERPHYAQKAGDIEYKTPFGWKEVEGIHDRGDWDLLRHSKFSKKDLSYYDEEEKKKYFPYIIETSAGVDRSFLMFLLEAYHEIKGGRTKTTKAVKKKEIVLSLNKSLAPVKVAVLPLVKKEKKLVKLAQEIFQQIKKYFMSQYDEIDSIGRRYRRQDEIGTPYCITVDFESLKDKAVTIRDRDSMKQERIPTKNILETLKKKLGENGGF